MNPTVSVIIPAYNTAAYLQRAIDSVLQQTLSTVEVIVVDDASTDNTLAIAQSIDDARVRVLQHPTNQGAGAARNTALDAARGEWIAILDSDDWFAPERLERLLAIAQTEDTEFIADDLFVVLDGEDQPRETFLAEAKTIFPTPQYLDPLLFIDPNRKLRLAFAKPLIRRAFLTDHQLRYDPSLRLGQDFWFYMQCFVTGARFFWIPEPYYYYRLRPNSLVNESRAARFEGFYRAAQDFLASPDVQKNPAWVAALTENLKTYQQGLAYYRVVEPLKQRQWKQAIWQMTQNPLFFPEFLKKLQAIVGRRWDYYIRGNSLAFEMRLKGQLGTSSQR